MAQQKSNGALQAPRKRASGPTQSEADRAANGMVQLKLRIGVQARERLGELAEDSGYSLSEMVEAMIDCEWDYWKEALKRRATKAKKPPAPKRGG